MQAEPSSSGKPTNLLNITIPTPGPSGGNTGVYNNTMEAVPDSPGPSVAPPSPDAVERSSRRGWRGVDLSSQDLTPQWVPVSTGMSKTGSWWATTTGDSRGDSAGLAGDTSTRHRQSGSWLRPGSGLVVVPYATSMYTSFDALS